MRAESRKQFGEVVFATGPVSTHLPFNLGFQSRKSKPPRPAAGRAACLEPSAEWKSAMGELGLVGRLRRRLSLKRKVKEGESTSNGITTTKILPKRSEGNRTNMKMMKMLMREYLQVEEMANSMQ